MLTSASVVLLLSALIGWGWVTRSGRGGGGRFDLAIRVGLVVVALAAHLNVVELRPGGVVAVTLPEAHLHDLFHYHLGTRYFGEVGYTGLYEAVVLADYEDDRSEFAPREPMRDLSDYRLKPRSVAVESAGPIRAHFTPERWRSFKRDVAAYRERMSPSRWRRAVADHGYNGTPLVTAWLGGVADAFALADVPLVRYAPLLDAVLIGLLCAAVWAGGGSALALTFLFFTFANPLNDFTFVGASYLRYSYFVALGGSFLALSRGRAATSGVLLAVAGWLRIFPLAIYGGLLLRDLAAPDWRARLRAGRRLHLAFAVASLAILGGTSLLHTPDGRNPWLAFADDIRMHGEKAGINQVFLAVPLTYSPARDRLHADAEHPGAGQVGPWGSGGPTWAEATHRARRERVWVVRAAAAALLGLSLLALRRSGRATAVLPCLLAMFCVLPMTHYHWAVLSLLPLALPRAIWLHRTLLVLFAALGLTSLRHVFSGHLDLQYALLSVEVLAFLVFCCAALWRGTPGRAGDPGPGQDGAALAAS